MPSDPKALATEARVPGLLPGVSTSLPERPESRDGVGRTDDSTPICRFCRFCHRPARAGVGPASIPGPGDSSDQSDETDASVAFVSRLRCD